MFQEHGQKIPLRLFLVWALLNSVEKFLIVGNFLIISMHDFTLTPVLSTSVLNSDRSEVLLLMMKLASILVGGISLGIVVSVREGEKCCVGADILLTAGLLI